MPKDIEFPKGHQVGVAVPKGGSSCASCAKLRPEMHCADPLFKKWNDGDNEIPAKEADEYCCDFWTEGEKKRKTMRDLQREQKEGK